MGVYRQQFYYNQFVLLIVDILMILGAFRLVCYFQRDDWQFNGDYPVFFTIFSLLWWILARRFSDATLNERLATYSEKFWALGRTFMLHAVALTAGFMILQVHLMPMRYLGLLYVMAALGVISARLILAFLHRTYRYRWAHPTNRFVIVGASRSGVDLYRFLSVHNSIITQCVGFFTDDPAPSDVRHLVLGRLDELQDFCRKGKIDEIYFALPLDKTELIQEISNFADDNFITFQIVPDFEGTLRKTVSVHYYDYGPILTVRRHPLGSQANRLSKRIFDLAFSGFVIIGIFPVIMPILALAIKLDSPGPIFFKQMRPGRHNKLFPCYKLRTMRTDLSGTELQATKGDVRVTRIGRFLRASSLDELPQFFNVLLGHMSVVGPRPNMVSQLEEYSKRMHTYAHRHTVTPGITGYAQVNGFRGETRTSGAMEKRVEYDLQYVENWSLLLDMQIILKTVKNMIAGEKNAY
jgi:putative colanic acid biosynthesis UDP-glucose lipid carrier transferase